MDDFRKKVGERIVAARERKGWNSAQLAKQAGVKPSTLLRWESGGSAQEGEGLAAIADACEVTQDRHGEKEFAHAGVSGAEGRGLSDRQQSIPCGRCGWGKPRIRA